MKRALPWVILGVAVVVVLVLLLAGRSVEGALAGAAVVGGARRQIRRTTREAEKRREAEVVKTRELQLVADEAAEPAEPSDSRARDLAEEAARRRRERSGGGRPPPGTVGPTILALGAALGLQACAHVPATTPFPDPIPRVELPELVAGEPAPDDCDDYIPIPPEVEAVVDDCVGIIVPPVELDLLLRAEDLLGVAREALDESYSGREGDRREVEAILAARELQLREARLGQGRALAIGGAVGGGATLVLVLVLVLAAR